MTRALVLSDTHVPQRARTLPEAVWTAVDAADLVIHAGDWNVLPLYEQLSARARRLLAVWGNNDGPELRAVLPEVATDVIDGVRVAVIHITEPKRREAWCDERFPDADVLVFGHSHIPWDTTTSRGLRLLNPGSPTDRRRQPTAHDALDRLRGWRGRRDRAGGAVSAAWRLAWRKWDGTPHWQHELELLGEDDTGTWFGQRVGSTSTRPGASEVVRADNVWNVVPGRGWTVRFFHAVEGGGWRVTASEVGTLGLYADIGTAHRTGCRGTHDHRNRSRPRRDQDRRPPRAR